MNSPQNPLDVGRYITVKTNGYGKFSLNGGLHEYSVSPQYAKATVLLRLTSSEVIVLDENGREIVRHRRLYGKQKQESMQWLPYLTQLSRNPGALKKIYGHLSNASGFRAELSGTVCQTRKRKSPEGNCKTHGKRRILRGRENSGFRFGEVTLPSGVTPAYLKNCEFLKTKTNVIMYGNVGTGKTHLSIALGMEACKRGVPTRFFRTAALVNQLSEAKKSGTLSSFMKKILKSDLMICDEWGYIPLDRTGAQLLFEGISECYERKTLIINTNLEFSKWVNVFYDEQMTSAILDRVPHHCHLPLFPGPSNRMRESGLAN